MRQLMMLVMGMLFAVSAVAADSGITVRDAWARATAPGQDNGAIEFVIASQHEAKLLSIASPAAGSVEIHSMVHENGRMKMRAVESLDLPAGKEVDLEASGYHIMLLKLKQPLKAGERVPFVLTVQFADRRKTTVQGSADVIPVDASHEMQGMPGMEDMKGMDMHHH